MIVQRGYKPAGNFHMPAPLAEPLGHYFYVMTNGYGAMPDYSAQVAPEDRWAIAAYIRALQLSQNASIADVPSGVKVESLADIAASEGLDRQLCRPMGIAAGNQRSGPSARTSSSSRTAGAAGDSQASKLSPATKAPDANATKTPAPGGS